MTVWPFTTFIRASDRAALPKRDKGRAKAARAARGANRDA